jgi:hypothetical protein
MLSGYVLEGTLGDGDDQDLVTVESRETEGRQCRPSVACLSVEL